MPPPTSPPSSPTIKTLLIGLSGPSSSGKTTLARLLRSIFNFSITIPNSHPPSHNTPPTLKITLSILHQDDFYLTDALIPLITTPPDCPSGLGSRELQDWDSVDSLDSGLFTKTLRHVKQHGELPIGDEWVSKEDQNAVGESGVSETEVERVKEGVERWVREKILGMGRVGRKEGEREKATDGVVTGETSTTRPPNHERDEEQLLSPAATETETETDTATPPTTKTSSNDQQPPGSSNDREIRIFILDGFLLYPNPAQNTTLHSITPLLTTKLFLPCTRSQTITRRTARTGYVTLEGFWADPPGYVEDVVWVNYVRDSRWLFSDEEGEKGRGTGENGVREGIVDISKAREYGIDVAPGMGTLGMSELVEWGVERVKKGVEEVLVKERAGGVKGPSEE